VGGKGFWSIVCFGALDNFTLHVDRWMNKEIICNGYPV